MKMGTKNEYLGTKKKPKNKRKAIKGSVSIQILEHTTRFKYRYQGEPYFLTIPKKANIPAIIIEQIRRSIETDILLQSHDNSQNKYKHWLRMDWVGATKLTDYQELKVTQGIQNEPIAEEYLPVDISMDKLLMQFMVATNRSDAKDVYHNAYRMVYNWVKDGLQVSPILLPELLHNMCYAARTYNDRKFVLNLFCKWMVKNKMVSYNPFEDVASVKRLDSKDPRRKRLTDEEIKLILDAIRTNRFLKSNNRGYNHSHYYPIFYFLAHTGVRPAEAIGLQVKKIDLHNKIITIDEAFARTRRGTCHSCRIFKSTKTGATRELPFNNNEVLEAVLRQQCEGRLPEHFVFPSPNNLSCDDRALNDTVLKSVLEGLRIPERVLYVFRHSFASRCFEQGMDIKSVQALTGHKDVSVLLNIYAEVNKSKISLPKLSSNA